MNGTRAHTTEPAPARRAAAWDAYRATTEAPWDLRRVVHLFRRVAFGATWQEIQEALRDGPTVTLDRLLSGRIRSRPPKDYEQTAGLLAEFAVATRHAGRVKAAWIYRLLFAPDPLGEQLTLMWHNHFATSNLKINDVGQMWRQHTTIRRLGRAPFAELLRAMLRDPALLIWLDAPENRQEAPNENLARELMELFTLGAGHYTEVDVKETARALTGWSLKDGEFSAISEHHDPGNKTILGKRGRWQADDVADILLDHAATARRIAWRICDHFLGEGVASRADIDALADGLNAGPTGNKLDVGWAVETVLRSAKFFDQANLNSRVVPPVDFVVSAVRSLELVPAGPSPAILADWLAELGQDLFYPPNVGGWTGGRSWLSPRTLVGRTRFADQLVRGRLGRLDNVIDVQALAQRNGFGTSAEEVLEFLGDLLLGRILDRKWKEEFLVDVGDSADDVRLLLVRVLSSPLAQLG